MVHGSLMKNSVNKQAYIIGGGIAGLSAAAYLIADGGMKGEKIHIFDVRQEMGGSFDGSGNEEKGYVSRGFRMFEDTVYLCSYDLFSKIPSPENPGKNLKDDFFEFNRKVKQIAKARLVENGKPIDARKMGLSLRDKLLLVKFLYLPEEYFGTIQIGEYFTPAFFKTNFWLLWSSTLAFQPWHSLVEMRRYLCRFVQDAPRMYNMSGVLSAPYCEYDFVIVPLVNWLKENGVRFENNREVIDLEFDEKDGKKYVKEMIFGGEGKEKIEVNKDDLVFITNGSMTAGSSEGSMENAPPQKTAKDLEKSASWALWNNIAKKSTDFGMPAVFCGSPQKTAWESFTITFRDPTFINLLEKLTGNKAGTGGLVTFKDSNWKMTITIPNQPYFKNQPEGTYVCWGYALNPENKGDYVNKKMSDCNGKEILEEICGHLGFQKDLPRILKSAVCIPSYMPYITSQFMPRTKSDRPKIVPAGSKNFAFIGQFVELPGEIVFTVECSVRSAKIAVKKLLNLPVKIPKLHNKQKFNPKLLLDGIRTIQG